MPEARAGASRTAVLVCQGRAVAHGRIAPGHFSDPVAMSLLHADERAAVERARTSTPPRRVSARIDYESLAAVAETMVPRTVAIDDAVRARPNPRLVILGAGLDGRDLLTLARRLPSPARHPSSQRTGRVAVADRA